MGFNQVEEISFPGKIRKESEKAGGKEKKTGTKGGKRVKADKKEWNVKRRYRDKKTASNPTHQ